MTATLTAPATATLAAPPFVAPAPVPTRAAVAALAAKMGWGLTLIDDEGDGYVWRLECVDGRCSMWDGDAETPAWNEFRTLADADYELRDMLAGV